MDRGDMFFTRSELSAADDPYSRTNIQPKLGGANPPRGDGQLIARESNKIGGAIGHLLYVS